jgi:branched-chain amino acid aminotransferase
MKTNQPILTAILTPDGLQETPFTASSLAEAAVREPGGVYTVTRTYQRSSTLELDAHLNRLEESAHLLGIALDLDRDVLCSALRALLDRSGYAESRFRLTVPANSPNDLYIAIEPLNGVPAVIRTEGASVKTFSAQRSNPRAKNTDWMNLRAALQAQMSSGTYEGLLTSPDGEILEGLGSNFYGIMNGVLRTASSGILHGISRRIVLEVAPAILPVQETGVSLRDITSLAEAFLTSSSRGIVPIVKIDEVTIGTGKPGPLILALSTAYDQWAQEHLEPI